MWISVIATKDKAAAKIKRILTAVERKSGNLLCALRTDGGGGLLQHISESIVKSLVLEESSLHHIPHNRMM
jgi:hypothetical protein